MENPRWLDEVMQEAMDNAIIEFLEAEANKPFTVWDEPDRTSEIIAEMEVDGLMNSE